MSEQTPLRRTTRWGIALIAGAVAATCALPTAAVVGSASTGSSSTVVGGDASTDGVSAARWSVVGETSHVSAARWSVVGETASARWS
jgi:hypothetical protein